MSAATTAIPISVTPAIKPAFCASDHVLQLLCRCIGTNMIGPVIHACRGSVVVSTDKTIPRVFSSTNATSVSVLVATAVSNGVVVVAEISADVDSVGAVG